MKNEPSPGDDDRPSPTPERHADTSSEAVSHTAHAERDDEPPVAPHRQVVNRRRTDVPRVDDDVHAVGQRGIQHRHRIPVTHAGAVEYRRRQFGAGYHLGHPHMRGPALARQRRGQASTASRVGRRCARACMADTVAPSRSRTPAPTRARRPDRRATSPSCGCPPGDTARYRRPRARLRDAPSRPSRRAPTTNPSRVCLRRPWRRALPPRGRAASHAGARVLRVHRRGRPAHRR